MDVQGSVICIWEALTVDFVLKEYREEVTRRYVQVKYYRPKIDPCGTPNATCAISERLSSICTK